ncbi:hypothetical protein EVAR_66283_1 [Eumeta japonica]|uniref:Uncharacterized protein n=1 Tax=Eumeta variegata TaxID=151549 RepID=A0A4C1YTM8_EUMVA|nr:hypothetical protein EVAR_66283_1 [Eumeta japonica]
MSAYTRQKAKSKYSDRIRVEWAPQEQSNDTHKTPYEREKQCKERKRMNAAERMSGGGPVHLQLRRLKLCKWMITLYIDVGLYTMWIMKTHCATASARFTTTFVNNPF